MIDPADREALFARIMEDPDDDAPRLIYSDILEESGDGDRAEFIRLQVRIARMTFTDPDRENIQSKIRDLELEHGVEWINELPHIRGLHWEIFERGFISTARIEKPDVLFENADSIFRFTPISRLRLHQFYSDDVRRMAPLSILNQIKELDMEDGCRAGNAGVEALVEEGQLKTLNALRLPGNNLGPSAARLIGTPELAPKLRYLDLSRNDFYDDGIESLVGNGHITQLAKLLLNSCRISHSGLGHLNNAGSWDQLRFLGLGDNPLGAGGMIIGANHQFSGLRALLMDGCGLGDGSMVAFLHACYLPELEWLYLRRNNFTDYSAELLTRTSHLVSLRQLNLGDNHVTRLHLPALQERYGPGVIVD
ncbi:TIGR02996 domain-containing protein [Zavarzinella formosa]|uniref:TIGR02996 domain-containing protein n=1 Tax=Zavarzinella formosa TaxID=360055 RepID=UPI00030FF68F|nr:TIGR02996 domain-containing protein [Zavarzinella formosa]